MDNKEAIREKIKKIEILLREIKRDLDVVDNSSAKKSNQSQYSQETLIRAGEDLYEKFEKEGRSSIEEYFKDKKADFIKEFCKANGVPITSYKSSKNQLIKEIIQWFAQKIVINQDIISASKVGKKIEKK